MASKIAGTTAGALNSSGLTCRHTHQSWSFKACNCARTRRHCPFCISIQLWDSTHFYHTDACPSVPARPGLPPSASKRNVATSASSACANHLQQAVQQAVQLHLGALCSWRPQPQVEQHVLDDLWQVKWVSARLLTATQQQRCKQPASAEQPPHLPGIGTLQI